MAEDRWKGRTIASSITKPWRDGLALALLLFGGFLFGVGLDLRPRATELLVETAARVLYLKPRGRHRSGP